MTFENVNKVLDNVNKIFERRKSALYALSLYYAALALNDFRARQSNEEFWNNQTFTAKDTVFSDAFFDAGEVGWYIAHGIEYGKDLELANNGQNAALVPTVNRFAKKYLDDARKII